MLMIKGFGSLKHIAGRYVLDIMPNRRIETVAKGEVPTYNEIYRHTLANDGQLE